MGSAVREKITVLYGDYKTATLDTIKAIRTRPHVAAGWAGLFGSLGYIVATNPAPQSYERAALVASGNELYLLSPAARNARTFATVQSARELAQQHQLYHLDLVLFSLILRKDTSADCKSYRHKIGQLEFSHPLSLSALNTKVVDVGAVGRWWRLERTMVDFDVEN
ncbi:hypothetical protein CAOG_003379 [Capsaspora owczarzaki ATCC 30864]|uniref:Uncharacterized protein n=2 Tax=Capsaspora owczarzaki (strain ATCC 30864) TaxID=595528 RepID=A0A0D2UBI5_CAPO3|nr:hypothetical protein CAOG_003379 [Capsaspora owczarzaki ATCC 30864]